MNITKVIQQEDLEDVLERVFEVIFLDNYEEPYDEDGHMSFSMKGKVFATNGGGGEYILLEDGTIGFNSGHGSMGRIAENMQEFLELIINCPYWEEFVQNEKYESLETLRDFSKVTIANLVQDMKENDFILSDEQNKVATCLGIKLYEDVAQDVLMRLFVTANRTLAYSGVYTEDNGEKNYLSGNIFVL